MASYYIANPPPLDWVGPQKLRSTIAQGGDLARGSRYIILINTPTLLQSLSEYSGLKEEMPFLVESGEVPGRSFNTLNYRYYGPTKLMPVQSEYNTFNVQLIVRTDMLEKQFFDDWFEVINPTSTFDFRYRKDYETTIQIFTMLDYDDGVSTATYNMQLEEAFPIAMEPIPLAWGDDGYMKLQIGFHYSKSHREGRDGKTTEFSLVEGREVQRSGGTVLPRVLSTGNTVLGGRDV